MGMSYGLIKPSFVARKLTFFYLFVRHRYTVPIVLGIYRYTIDSEIGQSKFGKFIYQLMPLSSFS